MAEIDPPLRPFEGLKVLDLSQGLAAPYAVQSLAVFGADVIKVEPPEGDWGRSMGERRGDMTALFAIANGGKRSIVVDARTDEGRRVLHRLARDADLVVDSFRPGVLAKIGMDFETLKTLRDPIVQLSVTGFGATGPSASRPGTDGIIQAQAGLTVVNGTADGKPHRMGMLVVDMTSGLYASIVLCALAAEIKAGGHPSRRLDVPLLAAASAFQAMPIAEHQMSAGAPRTLPAAPSAMFPTADGTLLVGGIKQRMFEQIAHLCGRPDWIDDPRYKDNGTRIRNADALHAEMAEVLVTKPSSHWQKLFDENNVLCAPVNDYGDLAEDPQVNHLDLLTPVDVPDIGTLRLPRFPGVGVVTGSSALPAPPRPGVDTAAVLSEIGIGPAEIGELTASRACVAA